MLSGIFLSDFSRILNIFEVSFFSQIFCERLISPWIFYTVLTEYILCTYYFNTASLFWNKLICKHTQEFQFLLLQINIGLIYEICVSYLSIHTVSVFNRLNLNIFKKSIRNIIFVSDHRFYLKKYFIKTLGFWILVNNVKTLKDSTLVCCAMVDLCSSIRLIIPWPTA